MTSPLRVRVSTRFRRLSLAKYLTILSRAKAFQHFLIYLYRYDADERVLIRHDDDAAEASAGAEYAANRYSPVCGAWCVQQSRVRFSPHASL